MDIVGAQTRRLSSPDCKTLYLVRHAQGVHNVALEETGEKPESTELFDAQLSTKGWQQAYERRKQVLESGLLNNIELVITSPLRRAMETSVGIFRGQEDKNISNNIPNNFPPIVALEICRERMGLYPCDRRASITTRRTSFPEIDFTMIENDEDALWRDKEREKLEEVATRGLEFLEWLWKRPEKEIAIVSHGIFLQQTLRALHEKVGIPREHSFLTRFANCELRSIRIEKSDMEADTLTASNSAAFYNIELVITSPLRRLVEENFENSLKTLDFCAALEQGLRRARDSHLLILVALQQFEDESLVQDAESPFNEDFFKMFQSVYSQQEVMLEKLRLRENELDKKLECIHTWRKLSSIIFVGTFATVLIGSFVATAMAAPHVAAAFGAATAPLDSMGKWIDSLWKNCENELKGEKEVISSMQAGTFVAVKDLDNIRVLIERLEIEIKGMVKSAEFAVEHDPVKIGIDDIKKKVDVFKKNVEELGVQADWCSRDIRRARTDYSEDHQASSSST